TREVEMRLEISLFFFQAEDGIRVFHVTGVQTCALPISAERWQENENDLSPLTTRVERSRQGLSLPRLPEQAFHRRPPREALGKRRRNETSQPGQALPLPPPRRTRRRHSGRHPRRRRVPIHQAERRYARQHRRRLHPTALGLDRAPCRKCRTRHSHRQQDRRYALVWRNDGLWAGYRSPAAKV